MHTNGGDRSNNLTKLELVENGGLSGGVQTNHQNSHLLLAPELIEKLGKCKTHVGDLIFRKTGEMSIMVLG